MDPMDFGIDISGSEIDIIQEKYKQIKEYNKLHKNINHFFLEGNNKYLVGVRQKFYFIDLNWLKEWKINTNYENAIQYLDKGLDYLKKNKIINENKYYFSNSINSGNSENIFLNKIIYKPEDFNCLIDNSSHKLFSINFIGYFFSNLKYIEGIFYDKMLVLLIQKQRRIKIFFKGEIEDKIELIQLILDFPEKDDKNQKNKQNKQSFFSKLIFGEEKYNYDKFIDKYIGKKCNELMNLLLRYNVGFIAEQWVEDGDITFHIYNNNLYKKYKKYLIEQEKLGTTANLSDSINSPRIIGLENIGATCYMNSTLQCLVNIDYLTRYLLISNNYINIANNSDICEILSCYCNLLVKLCCDEKVKNYYSPKEFKGIISIKNPLFQGIQANDSKDLIYFLLEQMNHEFNQINLKITNNINYNENDNIIPEDSQYD